MSIGATTKKRSYKCNIHHIFNHLHTTIHFRITPSFSKSKLRFLENPKNIKPKLFPVFLGRISFFVYFCPRNEKNRGRIL